MQVTKWYFDCVSDAGDVAIAYRVTLSWSGLSLHCVSTMLFRAGRVESSGRRERAAEPRIEGSRLTWEARDLEVLLESRAPAVEASLCGGSVEWRAVMPAAEARITVGDAVVAGRGYAEVTRIATAPWKLPIRELRWGRFTGGQSAAVWIDWKGPQPLTVAFRDGVRRTPATVDDSRVLLDGSTIALDERQVLRDAPLRDTLAAVPLLCRILPRRFTATRECKWRSRATLTSENGFRDDGWSIHEVVRFA